MKRVAEIMYIVEKEREEFLKGALNPDDETKKVLWLCGVRKQLYFALNDLIFMTFEYKGNNFAEDMSKMSAYLDSKNLLIKQRRKDVPPELRDTTNWWAPVKRLGVLLDKSPLDEEYSDYNILDMIEGSSDYNDNLAYDEDDWSEGFHF